MELILDRRLAERRIFPAIDVQRSGTRKEELLLSKEELDWMWYFRKATVNMAPWEAMEMLLDRMKKIKTNEEILQQFQNAVRKVGPVVTPDRPPDIRRELSS